MTRRLALILAVLFVCLTACPVALADRVWSCERVLNCGGNKACVGYAWATWSACRPIATDMDNADGYRIWRAACRVEGRKSSYGGGVHTASGLTVMKREGRIASVSVTQDVKVAKAFVLHHGPVVLETLWWPNMSYPHNGLMTADGGRLLGKHAYVWIGMRHGYAVIQNVWGSSWSGDGKARMSLRTIDTLLYIGGKAFLAVER